MKKTYINPLSRVHNLALRDGLMTDTSNVTLGSSTNPDDYASSSYTPEGSSGNNDARTDGTTNVWSNQW